ncbi:MAG: SH3 domain-containing protein [Anaerolineae bacterium]|nr:SH3 domain-containing protein [Anaerolineae bacterium]
MRKALLLLALVLLALPLPVLAQGADVDQWRAGEPTVEDNFSRNTGQWTVDSGREALSQIARGRLIISVPEEELFRWATLDTGALYTDFYVEVDAEPLAGPEDGMMGVVFRYTDADNFYAFITSADGYYALIAYVDGELDRLVDWTETDALDAGAENRLAVLAVGRELALYANDEELDRVTDRAFSEGQIALLAGTNADGGFDVGFDNFGLWAGQGTGRRAIRRSTPTSPQADAPARPADVFDAVVASDTLNVRGGPGTNYPVVGQLKRGDTVTIVGRSADSKWAKLGYGDVKEAWASAQYLTINIDFAGAPVAAAPPAPKPAPAQAAKNVAYLVIENHIGRYITVQVNDKNFRVEGKVGDKPGRYQFELQGAGRYRVAAQLPNAGAHNWDLYVEPTAEKCAGRQGCIALGIERI